MKLNVFLFFLKAPSSPQCPANSIAIAAGFYGSSLPLVSTLTDAAGNVIGTVQIFILYSIFIRKKMKRNKI